MNNKSNRTAIALIVGLIICAVLFALLAPKTFNWDLPPQNRNTEQPFAQTVMHDVLSHSFQHGYRVSDDLREVLRQQRKDTCENLIVSFDDNNPAEEDNFAQLDRIARLAKSGRRIIYTSYITTTADHSFFGLIDEYDGGDWRLDLKAKDEPKIDPSKIDLLPFPVLDANHRLSLSERGGQESVFRCMIGKSFLKLDLASGRFSRNIDFDHSGQDGILLRRSLLRFEREEDAPPHRITDYGLQRIRALLVDNKGHVYGLRYEFASGGSITWLAGSAMLTNYGLSAPEWRGLSRPILADLDNRPVCFVNAQYLYAEEESAHTNNSVLSFFVERPPLRLALWIPIGMGLLALLFNTRRRFRAERYLPRPRNSSLPFVHQLSTLFKDKQNYAVLARNELHLLLDILRREYRFEQHNSTLFAFAPRFLERDTRGLLNSFDLELNLARLDQLLDAENQGYYMTRSEFLKISKFTQRLLLILQSQPNT
ncbi:MAG: hypothetical protein HXL28_08645 [Prevotellaceae bacterium]|jgi:hypothetical protein|nr:hypothetical protein [Prevotellaceae bacterium]